MHELAVTENILETVLEYADREGAVAVTDIYLRIGQLSSIVDDSVQFYWDFVSKGTKAERATLHFDRIAAKFHCNACGHEYEIPEILSPCPRCKSMNVKLIAGDEFLLQTISVEKPE